MSQLGRGGCLYVEPPELSSKAAKWSACDENLKSFAHMAVAAQVGCSWCLDFGYFHAHNEGLDEAKASQVPVWRTSEVFSPLEREVMEFAEAMTATPPTVTDEQFAHLLGQLGEPAMVELTTQVALANLYARSSVAMGIESQGFSPARWLILARPDVARHVGGGEAASGSTSHVNAIGQAASTRAVHSRASRQG